MTTLGVLGGGQLGQMIANAARAMDVQVRCFDPSPDACARSAAPLTIGDFDDLDAVEQFASVCDKVTIEFEKVPVRTIEALIARGHHVAPGPQSLCIAQDRVLEKQLFESIGLSVPPYAAVDSESSLREGLAKVGLPAVLKTRRDGYDGKGQFVIRSERQIAEAWQAVRAAPCIVESLVDFRRELSVIAARDLRGNTHCFPTTENVHREGILHRSVAPALNADHARAHVERLMEQLDHVGVLTLELFEGRDGTLLGNEFAPRVHNSGHWTLNAGNVDQFTQHVRAVVDLEILAPELTGAASMINLVGSLPPPQALHGPGLSAHLYGKTPRPGRKLGHVNWQAPDPETARSVADEWALRWLNCSPMKS